MSNVAINWAYKQDIPMAPKFILVTLADMANDEGECHPGQANIAKKIGSSRRTVQRGIEWLEEHGYLKSHERRRPDGYKTSNRYQLAVGEEVVRADLSRSGVRLSGDNLSTLRRHSDASGTISRTTSNRYSAEAKNDGIQSVLKAWEDNRNGRPRVAVMNPKREKAISLFLDECKKGEFDPVEVMTKAASLASVSKGYIEGNYGLFNLLAGGHVWTWYERAQKSTPSKPVIPPRLFADDQPVRFDNGDFSPIEGWVLNGEYDGKLGMWLYAVNEADDTTTFNVPESKLSARD